MMRYTVEGVFRLQVEAPDERGARQAAMRILGADGVHASVTDVYLDRHDQTSERRSRREQTISAGRSASR